MIIDKIRKIKYSRLTEEERLHIYTIDNSTDKKLYYYIKFKAEYQSKFIKLVKEEIKRRNI